MDIRRNLLLKTLRTCGLSRNPAETAVRDFGPGKVADAELLSYSHRHTAHILRCFWRTTKPLQHLSFLQEYLVVLFNHRSKKRRPDVRRQGNELGFFLEEGVKAKLMQFGCLIVSNRRLDEERKLDLVVTAIYKEMLIVPFAFQITLKDNDLEKLRNFLKINKSAHEHASIYVEVEKETRPERVANILFQFMRMTNPKCGVPHEALW